jgi:2-phosphosulfolactate phosphatase
MRAVAGGCDVVVIVDILSFTTAVDVAVSRGAAIYPHSYGSETARALADSVGARLAGPRSAGGLSLSPASLEKLTPGERLVLPSPNGSRISVASPCEATFAACLRNARAVAAAARAVGLRIAVIASGERWPDGSLRPAIEDWLGAGAVIEHLGGSLSPDAFAARAAFRAAGPDIGDLVIDSLSGRELLERGHSRDLFLTVQVDASACVPRLIDHAYRDASRPAAR